MVMQCARLVSRILLSTASSNVALKCVRAFLMAEWLRCALARALSKLWAASSCRLFQADPLLAGLRAGRHSAEQRTKAFSHGGVREHSIAQRCIWQLPHHR